MSDAPHVLSAALADNTGIDALHQFLVNALEHPVELNGVEFNLPFFGAEALHAVHHVLPQRENFFLVDILDGEPKGIHLPFGSRAQARQVRHDAHDQVAKGFHVVLALTRPVVQVTDEVGDEPLFGHAIVDIVLSFSHVSFLLVSLSDELVTNHTTSIYLSCQNKHPPTWRVLRDWKIALAENGIANALEEPVMHPQEYATEALLVDLAGAYRAILLGGTDETLPHLLDLRGCFRILRKLKRRIFFGGNSVERGVD